MLDLLQLIDLSCYSWLLVKSHNLVPRSLLNEAEDNIWGSYHLHGKTGNSVWEASENMGCDLKQFNVSTLLSL